LSSCERQQFSEFRFGNRPVYFKILGEYRNGGSSGGNIKDPISYVRNIVLDNVRETGRKWDGALIYRAAELINGTENVFFAADNSYFVALNAAYKLSGVGLCLHIQFGGISNIQRLFFQQKINRLWHFPFLRLQNIF
jgi:hypothetical protein